MKTQQYDIVTVSSASEKDALKELCGLLKNTPIPDDELLANLGLYLNSKTLSRILFFSQLYQKILTTHGVIVEFGVRWGQTLSILSALRGIFEPFNRFRKIIGFDTFEGFKGVSDKDGVLANPAEGHYSVSPAYEKYLTHLLKLQETLNPISHLRKYEIVKGDVRETLPCYLKGHPETIVSLAVFDLDLYDPTKTALQAIKPNLCKGSILIFDDLCVEFFPGETIAVNEVFGLNNVRIQRTPLTSRISYVEIL